jgi:hypothetical protein
MNSRGALGSQKDTAEQARVFSELLEECSQIVTKRSKDFKLIYTLDGLPISSFNELIEAMNYTGQQPPVNRRNSSTIQS